MAIRYWKVPFVLTISQINPISLSKIQFRNAVASDDYIWPNGVIPYLIDGDLSSRKDLIQNAMNQIQRFTCIRFRPKTADDRYYIRLFKGNGCYASIGRDPDFPEGLVSLGEGCYYMGTVVHELMHTIGKFTIQSALVIKLI